MGICSFPHNILNASQLLKQTDMAMYKAKAMGKNNFQFFTQALADKEYEKFILELKLKHAIENNEFYLVYQPQIRLIDNKLVGVEALIRWKSSELNLVSPLKFIPIAEQCGFIDTITNWVIKDVCRQIKLWDKEGFQPMKIAINLSRQELGKKNMAKRVSSIIEKEGIPFSRIEFEVTESALFENAFYAFKNISDLRLMGFVISIDDFGTGYSSLSNLKDFLFDKLKIDRSFIMDIAVKKEYESIIKAIIAIAKSLNLKVLAEGVETKEQLDFLRLHGCEEIQGYFYSPPIRSEELLKLGEYYYT
jgi:EAL domain-containing protein (putative c-di-GMP-specific phosphodiesterase class I)